MACASITTATVASFEAACWTTSASRSCFSRFRWRIVKAQKAPSRTTVTEPTANTITPLLDCAHGVEECDVVAPALHWPSKAASATGSQQVVVLQEHTHAAGVSDTVGVMDGVSEAVEATEAPPVGLTVSDGETEMAGVRPLVSDAVDTAVEDALSDMVGEGVLVSDTLRLCEGVLEAVDPVEREAVDDAVSDALALGAAVTDAALEGDAVGVRDAVGVADAAGVLEAAAVTDTDAVLLTDGGVTEANIETEGVLDALAPVVTDAVGEPLAAVLVLGVRERLDVAVILIDLVALEEREADRDTEPAEDVDADGAAVDDTVVVTLGDLEAAIDALALCDTGDAVTEGEAPIECVMEGDLVLEGLRLGDFVTEMVTEMEGVREREPGEGDTVGVTLGVAVRDA